MVVSLRLSSIPPNLMLLTDNNTVPSGYNLDSSYDGKYLRNVPDDATNPGTIVGLTTHTHSSDGDHSHTGSSAAHNHTGSTGSASAGSPHNTTTGGLDYANITHVHSITFASTTPTLTVVTEGAHTHDTINNDPPFLTYRMIKKDGVVHMKQKSMPDNTLVLWRKVLALIPGEFGLDTASFAREVKSDATAGTTGGNADHTHDSKNHKHDVQLATHTHGASSIASFLANITNGTSGFTPAGTHGHGVGSTTAETNTASQDSDTIGDHTHDLKTNVPASTELGMIKLNSVHMRRFGIPFTSIAFWEDTLATIPTNFGLTDGTGDTDNLLAKHPVGIPNGSTEPGSNVGSDTHQHNVQGTHVHADTSPTHLHVKSGTTGSHTATQSSNPGGGFTLATTHNHAISGNTVNNAPVIALTVDDTHNHDSLNNIPDSKEIALIQRV